LSEGDAVARGIHDALSIQLVAVSTKVLVEAKTPRSIVLFTCAATNGVLLPLIGRRGSYMQRVGSGSGDDAYRLPRLGHQREATIPRNGGSATDGR
jgi:hypothetical protein